MNHTPKHLSTTCEINIRFNEADPMGIVWHGHYIQYFEDGREAFGREHGIGYSKISNQGLSIPIVSISCSYKLPIKYGDRAIIETTYIDSDAAKIEFEYKIYRASDLLVAATGKSTQVFLDKSGNLQLLIPKFVMDWKISKGLI